MFDSDSVSSQIVAPQNTRPNNLCYENVLLSSPKYRAETNINTTKSISTSLEKS